MVSIHVAAKWLFHRAALAGPAAARTPAGLLETTPHCLLLLSINNTSDAQATQSRRRKGQAQPSLPEGIALHNCPTAEAQFWAAANALGLIRPGSRWEFSDGTILLENADS